MTTPTIAPTLDEFPEMKKRSDNWFFSLEEFKNAFWVYKLWDEQLWVWQQNIINGALIAQFTMATGK